MLGADSSVYLRGTQYFRDFLQNAPRDFVDKVDLRTSNKTRVFQSPADAVETVATPLDDDFTKAIVVRGGRTHELEVARIVVDDVIEARAGDQVDLGQDPRQNPSSPAFTGERVGRPAVPLRDNDFWVHGLTFGVRVEY